MKDTCAIILAGGQGTRMGKPKQMLLIKGKSVVERSIDAFKSVSRVAKIIVVSKQENIDILSKKYRNITFALAGETRIASLKNGLAALGKNKYKLIAVHDGARPLVLKEDIENCLKSASKNKAAVLGVMSKDTIKQIKDGFVCKTLKRSELFCAQTPQCYQTQILQKAILKYGALDATDESQLVEKIGVKVKAVLGSYSNIKITTPEDLIIAEALCKKTKK
ncbi:MAG: 2-C-methyl-D-erythritol 4-phosphate cytidylyltransferase [Elusimicrobiaceae bacterium]|nr:2-C-methyl-D-erythritol 4-phosphate cytidylyltransferase [Elusimicrobiaceae bacterium]